MARRLHIDIETFSECDLKKCGSHVYAKHPSTKILCIAYAIDDGRVGVWRPTKSGIPDDLLHACKDPDTEVHAWNAGGFERIFFRGVPAHRWRDTMIRAAYWGLPMSLDQAGQALRLDIQKDMAGRRLMLSMSKPRKNGLPPWHEADQAKYDQLCEYCKQDVEAERAIANALPELPREEQELWELDCAMMDRGVPLDLNSVRALEDLAQKELRRLNAEMCRVTSGAVPTVNSVAALLNWCKHRSIRAQHELHSLDKAAIEAFIAAGHTSVNEALSIRLEAAKSSVAKLQAMVKSAGHDNRIRGLTQFYGASRTGRWAGRLVQVQNLPRGVKGVDPRKEIETIKVAAIKYCPPKYDPPDGKTSLEVVSSCLRACFRGGFAVGDFSQIEARVVAWLAGQQDILDVFARGEDVYTYTANKLGSRDRQFGKVLVLACGFGMGWAKFKDTAATYGLALSDAEAENAVKLWREANPYIVQFWYALEAAAIAVLDGKKKIATAGKISFAMGSRRLAGCLLMRLPSGRMLVYRNARTYRTYTREGWSKPGIAYDGVNQTTRKWGMQGTYGGKLAENATQAVARDLLAHALINLEGLFEGQALVTIHDEVVCETGPGFGAPELKACMESPPAWAKGLPVGSDTKEMQRYGK